MAREPLIAAVTGASAESSWMYWAITASALRLARLIVEGWGMVVRAASLMCVPLSQSVVR